MADKIRTIKDLKVYNFAFEISMEVFWMAKKFPKIEDYSLTSQITRSSRSVSANIREGYAKRSYENVFHRHLVDAMGSSEETRTWLEYAHECKYIDNKEFDTMDKKYDKLTAMLFNLAKNWQTYNTIKEDESDYET